MALIWWNKLWVIVVLCSVLVYDLYWLSKGVERWLNYILNGIPINLSVSLFSYFIVDYVIPVIGDAFRFVGVSLALVSAYLVWRPKPKPFSNVKKQVAVAIFFEAMYFLSLLSTNIYTLTYGFLSIPVLNLAYILQVLLVSPVLIVLSFKVWRYQETAKANVLKWACVAAIGYLAGIWLINVFKWLSMAQSAGIGFILSGITTLGFLNAAVTLSMSLIFAIAGFYTLSKKENRRLSIRLFALALILCGLHFAIFILYSAVAPGAWKFVLLTEIWPITLLGLGFGMLTGEI